MLPHSVWVAAPSRGEPALGRPGGGLSISPLRR